MTLVEMLVTVAVLVLMMTLIVQIFQSATGAVQGLQVYEQLDSELRQLDQTLRSDLQGVTARLTPPLDPKDNLGYFEYGENAFADLQGEDVDDYIRFTAKAPVGRPFTGRFWPLVKLDTSSPPDGIPDSGPFPLGVSSGGTGGGPVMITSDYAEIIYFLRNGNLYRRVFLVAPDRQSSIVQMASNVQYYTTTSSAFTPSYFDGNLTVSWQGMNDLSARPRSNGSLGAGGAPNSTYPPIVLNTLGDLTNRENRAFNPRFCNDFDGDGIPDDTNLDGVPDYYPNFYCADPNSAATPTLQLNLINEPVAATRSHIGLDAQAFPYIYQWAYSQPDTNSTDSGWIHSPDPAVDPSVDPATKNASGQLNGQFNHAPLETGDSLPVPTSSSGQTQSYWGFPTSIETLSSSWVDPTYMVGPNAVADITKAQPSGLRGFTTNTPPGTIGNTNTNWLPNLNQGYPSVNRLQPFNDGFGSSSFDVTVNAGGTFLPAIANKLSPDELIMTGVRSFDVKAYDDLYPGYVDLGWGSDLKTVLGNGTDPVGYNQSQLTVKKSGLNQLFNISRMNGGPIVYTNQGTYAHEGRMPPRSEDCRYDYQLQTSTDPTIFQPPYAGYQVGGVNGPYGNTSDGFGAFGNLGDDRPTVRRLRRVFDTWSTDYSRAPMSTYNSTATSLQPYGPQFHQPPLYPSYPPPYEMPLRGLQIQIRVVDPRNQKVKVLTIRHDFSEKL